jgi:hypothetical protein
MLYFKHIEQLISLEECKYPSKTYKSYYSNNWNWHYIDVRRNRKDDFMLIAGFHPQNLASVIIELIFYLT